MSTRNIWIGNLIGGVIVVSAILAHVYTTSNPNAIEIREFLEPSLTWLENELPPVWVIMLTCAGGVAGAFWERWWTMDWSNLWKKPGLPGSKVGEGKTERVNHVPLLFQIGDKVRVKRAGGRHDVGTVGEVYQINCSSNGEVRYHASCLGSFDQEDAKIYLEPAASSGKPGCKEQDAPAKSGNSSFPVETRVRLTREYFSVPAGAEGVVIANNGSILDVRFDGGCGWRSFSLNSNRGSASNAFDLLDVVAPLVNATVDACKGLDESASVRDIPVGARVRLKRACYGHPVGKFGSVAGSDGEYMGVRFDGCDTAEQFHPLAPALYWFEVIGEPARSVVFPIGCKVQLKKDTASDLRAGMTGEIIEAYSDGGVRVRFGDNDTFLFVKPAEWLEVIDAPLVNAKVLHEAKEGMRVRLVGELPVGHSGVPAGGLGTLQSYFGSFCIKWDNRMMTVDGLTDYLPDWLEPVEEQATTPVATQTGFDPATAGDYGDVIGGTFEPGDGWVVSSSPVDEATPKFKAGSDTVRLGFRSVLDDIKDALGDKWEDGETQADAINRLKSHNDTLAKQKEWHEKHAATWEKAWNEMNAERIELVKVLKPADGRTLLEAARFHADPSFEKEYASMLECLKAIRDVLQEVGVPLSLSIEAGIYSLDERAKSAQAKCREAEERCRALEAIASPPKSSLECIEERLWLLIDGDRRPETTIAALDRLMEIERMKMEVAHA